MRAGVEELAVARGYPITVSIGVAVAHQPCSLHNAMKAADAAMYDGKHNGRNKVSLIVVDDSSDAVCYARSLLH